MQVPRSGSVVPRRGSGIGSLSGAAEIETNTLHATREFSAVLARPKPITFTPRSGKKWAKGA